MRQNTSWDHVSTWYDKLVGEHGGYYHQHVIFPKTTALLAPKAGMRVLDLACGQGVYSRMLAEKGCLVTAVDQSPSLIEKAKRYKNGAITYIVDDARTLHRVQGTFDRIVSVMAIQNFDPIDGTFRRAAELLVPGGRMVVIMLHPCFRSPRITGWGEDPARKMQYRRVDRYMEPMRIPITMHPGQRQSQVTWTFHRPLSFYIQAAAKAGLVCTAIEEWVSDKSSVGKNAKAENLARNEIPMFMALALQKL